MARDRRRSRPATARHFPRTARLNALLTEIVADHFERVDDDDLGFITITGAEVDADLNVLQVFVSTLDEPDPENDARILDALAGHRTNVQRDIARQAKLRKTPDVVFAFDPGVRAGARIDAILADIGPIGPDDEPEPDAADAVGPDPVDGHEPSPEAIDP